MNNRAKLELCEAALERARPIVRHFYRGLVPGQALTGDQEAAYASLIEALTSIERALGALEPKTSRHDAGAVARCSYCERYTASHIAFSARLMLRCDCGMFDGWSGSFPRPTSDSAWSIGSEWVAR